MRILGAKNWTSVTMMIIFIFTYGININKYFHLRIIFLPYKNVYGFNDPPSAILSVVMFISRIQYSLLMFLFLIY
jgi:hypothetical protein